MSGYCPSTTDNLPQTPDTFSCTISPELTSQYLSASKRDSQHFYKSGSGKYLESFSRTSARQTLDFPITPIQTSSSFCRTFPRKTLDVSGQTYGILRSPGQSLDSTKISVKSFDIPKTQEPARDYPRTRKIRKVDPVEFTPIKMQPPAITITDSSSYPSGINHSLSQGFNNQQARYGTMDQRTPSIHNGSNLGYDYEAPSRPTDFDALFSGQSRPSVVVSGLDEPGYQATDKASKILGINNPGSLVYENSGFSRNVHFDISQLPEDIEQAPTIDQGEYYAKKLSGGSNRMANWFDFVTDSVATNPKKSKSRLVSLSKMNKNARWLEWSENMRMENQIKKEEFLKKREEAAKNKLPAPIIKARKESVKFGTKEVDLHDEETPLSRALLDNIQPPTNAMMDKTHTMKSKYTEEQWMRLHEFWDHGMFRKARTIGLFLALAAMIATIPPTLSTKWIEYDVKIPLNYTWDDQSIIYEYGDNEIWNCSNINENGTCWETYYKIRIEIHGFWFNCTTNLTSYSGVNDPACEPLDRTGKNEWQSAVIGLLLFALVFGFLATVLTTCGVCAHSLAKKVYYYHSAGEIYFVCGVCSTAALIAYPSVLSNSKQVPQHTFGIGYYLAWAMPVCYFISAFCMTLDDMIHSLTNECCSSFRRKNAEPNHV